jgi:Arc-like DNA binding domain
MKDAVVTVRLPAALRRQIERVARTEGRSPSAQIERLVEAGLNTPSAPARPAKALSGLFAGSRVPTLGDFRDVRLEISRSLTCRTGL